MAHAIWKGIVEVGPISVMVRLTSGTQDNTVRFRQVHEGCGGRVGQKRYCKGCGDESPDVVKGYELADGGFAVVDEADIKATLPDSKRVNLEQFVDPGKIPLSMVADTYYLVADEKVSAKGYGLLVSALKATKKAGLGKVCLRRRERMCLLRVDGGVLVLHTLRWPDEIRALPEAPDVEVSKKELDLTAKLVEALAGPYEASEWADETRARIEALVQASVDGGEILRHEEEPPPPPDKAEVVDLMAALRRELGIEEAAS